MRRCGGSDRWPTALLDHIRGRIGLQSERTKVVTEKATDSELGLLLTTGNRMTEVARRYVTCPAPDIAGTRDDEGCAQSACRRDGPCVPMPTYLPQNVLLLFAMIVVQLRFRNFAGVLLVALHGSWDAGYARRSRGMTTAYGVGCCRAQRSA